MDILYDDEDDQRVSNMTWQCRKTCKNVTGLKIHQGRMKCLVHLHQANSKDTGYYEMYM